MLEAQQQTYELPDLTTEQRWTRAAQLGAAVSVAWIKHAKDQGMTPEDLGEVWAEIFGPPRGWTGADTPWRLFRGIAYNFMSNPGQTVEVLEAGDSMVRGRFNRPWVEWIAGMEEDYGVPVSEYEAVLATFGESLAEHHGMMWDQRVQEGDLVITVTRP